MGHGTTSAHGRDVVLAKRTVLIDLSHGLSERTPPWPGNEGFRRKPTSSYEGGALASFNLALAEHTGTHIDAPRHAFPDGLAVRDLALRALIAPLVVVAAEDAGIRDGIVRLSHLRRHESRYGRIGVGVVVAIRTGWSREWPTRYFMLDAAGVAHYPSVSAALVGELIQRGVEGIGMDTPSVDKGAAVSPAGHAIALGAGRYLLENLTGLEALPPTGAWIVTLPLPLEGGTGSPARVVALIGGPR